jgi:hypothetical protein
MLKAMPATRPAAVGGANVRGLAEEVLANAVLHLSSEGEGVLACLVRWRDSAKSTEAEAEFRDLLDKMDRLLRGGAGDVAEWYRSSGGDRLEHLLSSFRLANDPESSLASCFVGCLSLVTDFGLISGFCSSGVAIGRLVQRVWRSRIMFPAEFSLARLSVPSVQRACSDGCEGFQLAARILTAAEAAVHVRVPEDTRRILVSLADSGSLKSAGGSGSAALRGGGTAATREGRA